MQKSLLEYSPEGVRKTIDVLIGDCREVLKTLPEKSVHCCVTSPPYYGLRDYGVSGQLGLENSPSDYVNNLVNVFSEVKRVLRDDGTLWLNLGDSYSGSGKGYGAKDHGKLGKHANEFLPGKTPIIEGLKPKNLIGIPWRVAFALQADGWYLRQDIIWSKNNPMPESVKDRCTKSHEYIFLLSKSQKYYFDNEAIKEPNANPARKSYVCGSRSNGVNKDRNDNDMVERSKNFTSSGRNKRSVWQVNTKPYKGAHFATFPSELIDPCLKAGTSEHGVCYECGAPFERVTEKTGYTEHGGLRKRADAPGAEVSQSSVFRTGLIPTTQTVGWQPSCTCNALPVPATVLDPFGGSGTVGQWCNQNNRYAVLIELNPEYKQLIEERINSTPKHKPQKRKVSHVDKLILQQNLTQYFT